MRIVLTANIKGLGIIGDVRNVSDGYAKNFLFPKKLAQEASATAIAKAQENRRLRSEATLLAQQDAVLAAKKLEGTIIEVRGKASLNGKLFAGIEAHAIADAASKIADIHIPPSSIHIEHSLKTIGDHEVSAVFASGVSAKFTVKVSPE